MFMFYSYCHVDCRSRWSRSWGGWGGSDVESGIGWAWVGGVGVGEWVGERTHRRMHWLGRRLVATCWVAWRMRMWMWMGTCDSDSSESRGRRRASGSKWCTHMVYTPRPSSTPRGELRCLSVLRRYTQITYSSPYYQKNTAFFVKGLYHRVPFHAENAGQIIRQ